MSHKSTVRVVTRAANGNLRFHDYLSTQLLLLTQRHGWKHGPTRDDANKMLFHLNAVRTISRSRRICPLGQAKLAKEETTARRVDELFKEFADLGLAQTVRSRC